MHVQLRRVNFLMYFIRVRPTPAPHFTSEALFCLCSYLTFDRAEMLTCFVFVKTTPSSSNTTCTVLSALNSRFKFFLEI